VAEKPKERKTKVLKEGGGRVGERIRSGERFIAGTFGEGTKNDRGEKASVGGTESEEKRGYRALGGRGGEKRGENANRKISLSGNEDGCLSREVSAFTHR